ncbi:MAG: hypothetical protein HQ592_14925 [Planctomycetes bacterium]|nr:hypothetical protein [Planctomycetota bacterium]
MLSNDPDLKTILDRLTLEEKVGQLLMIPPQEESIRKLRPGSVIVGDGNFDDDIPTARSFVAGLQKLHAEQSSIPLWMHGFVCGKAWAGPRDRRQVFTRRGRSAQPRVQAVAGYYLRPPHPGGMSRLRSTWA